MTDQEAIVAVRCGQRMAGPYSLRAETGPPCPGWNHHWRVLFCDDETDVVECRDCGAQDLTRCNFEEDFA